jgi:hypothetical protein
MLVGLIVSGAGALEVVRSMRMATPLDD